jgi:hypothetical protein
LDSIIESCFANPKRNIHPTVKYASVIKFCENEKYDSKEKLLSLLVNEMPKCNKEFITTRKDRIDKSTAEVIELDEEKRNYAATVQFSPNDLEYKDIHFDFQDDKVILNLNSIFDSQEKLLSLLGSDKDMHFNFQDD